MRNKSKEAQTIVITTLSHIHPLSTIKGKLKSREERCKHKITPKRVIEEETEVLSENLSTAFQAEIDPLVNKLEYTNIKKTLQA